MKKSIYIIASVLFVASFQSAQSQNWLTAGNSLGGTEKLGSTNNTDLRLFSNNAQTLTLKAAGDLDLNTSSKAYMINGNKVLWHGSSTTNFFGGVGAGANTTGANNTFFGNNAGNANVAGTKNTAVGFEALKSSSTSFGTDETAIGNQALKNYNGNEAGLTAVGSGALFTITAGGFESTAVGYHALNSATSISESNTAVGHYALRYNTEGLENCAFGDEALSSNVKAIHNNSFGTESMANNTYASENVAIGYQALVTLAYTNGAPGTVWSSYNVAIGNRALKSTNASSATTEGIKNTAIGHEAGYSNTTASENFFGGYRAGYTNTTGTANAIVGFEAGYWNQTGSGNSIFGYQAGGRNAASTNSHSNNSFFGYRAGYNNKTNTDNVAVGYQALFTQNSLGLGSATCQNTAVGNEALYTTNPSASNNGRYNTALGYRAGYLNTDGTGITCIGLQAAFNNTANYTTAVGFQAGFNNTSGLGNTHIGIDAGFYNRIGTNNTTLGYMAGFGNVTTYNNSSNTFLGYKAGYSVQSGGANTVVGYQAAYSLTTAGENVFVGNGSGYAVTSGTSNSCLGISSGSAISTSGGNVCIGSSAGSNITTSGNGNNNTCVGSGSNVTGTYSNAGAFGYNAVNNQGSNTIWLGNATCNAIWVATGGSYNVVSDGRFKTNIKEEVKGLEFINKLRPVTYQMDTKKLDVFKRKSVNKVIARTYTDSTGTHTTYDTLPDPTLTTDYAPSSAIVHSGFIAQEVAAAVQSCGFNSTIVKVPSDSNMSNYGMDYSEIVVPLVKAVQELSKNQDSLFAVIATLKGAGQRNNNGDTTQGKSESVYQLELANNSAPILYQNEPNPFNGSTVIRYFIPENNIGSAYVGFYDMYGKEIKKLEITEKGFGKIEASTENLASGIYSYSIVVDGKTVETKKMLKSK